MRVGIYNRWLSTLGGGEKHGLAVAEYLSQRHEVEVISHQPTPGELVASRLGLDLSRVRFIAIPDRMSQEVAPISAEYDLFISASHMDYFPSYAPKSAVLIFFPLRVTAFSRLGRKLKSAARRWFRLPAVLAGFHAFGDSPRGFKWTADTELIIQLPAHSQAYTFSFNICRWDERVHRVRLELDGSLVDTLRLPGVGETLRYELQTPVHIAGRRHALELIVEGDLPVGGSPKIEVSDLALSLPRYRLYQELFERRLRPVGHRLQHYFPSASIGEYMDTYQAIWANSEFTRRWIKTYWQRNSQVLYPLINVEDFVGGEKRQQILNVGRFFSGSHNKKHLEMVRAFRGMVDGGLSGWELHLAGGAMPEAEHQVYLEEVRRLAAGYPVSIHTSIAFQDLARLYAESAIYWHASGYGESEPRDPDKFEHFGITTVEAMSAGCAPVVIGKGGQPEIVVHGENGYLWRTLGQLQAYTRRLIDEPTLRQSISAAAVRQSRSYDRAHFQARLEHLLDQMGVS
ncbi:MAG: glycosyltransferase [Chloroflexi bacterium]|nr:glycosyltransferase [Chloroflexota bacterium]